MPKFKKVSADEARSKARKDMVRSGPGGVEVMVKGFKAPPSYNAEKRSARFIMTSETVDRYGDIVAQAGMDITRFMENPQGLLFHNSRSWPCGTWSDVTKILNGRPKRTEGVLNFLPEGTDDDADRAVRHVAVGSIRTVSIGFAPDWDEIEMILDDEGEWVTGWKYNKSELLECSLVPIPAQPDALVKDAGGDFQLARDLIEEVLDTYTRTPEGLLIPLDEYRAKHMDLVHPRSYHVIKGLTLDVEPKTVSPDVVELTATTDEEAEAYVGATVLWAPGNAENAEDALANGHFKDCTGEVIASYIVANGEFKGVHALAVEWSEKDGTAVGMYRGLKAERVILAKVKSEEEPAEEEETAPVEEEAPVLEETIEAPELTDAVIDAFVALAATAEVGIEVGDDTRITARGLDGAVVAELIMLDTMTVKALNDLKSDIEGRIKAAATAPTIELPLETLDTTELEAKVGAFSKLLDGVMEKFASLFKQDAAPERVEPPVEATPEIKPLTAAEIEAINLRASTTAARLKALIGA